ncbi:MAG: hypothetical protein HY254_18975, partial [Burkholderiales bacterium]|nr:hypothetical protein [Burkholderiales bacterium]
KGHIAMVPSIQTGGGSSSAVDAFLALAAKDLLNKGEGKTTIINAS